MTQFGAPQTVAPPVRAAVDKWVSESVFSPSETALKAASRFRGLPLEDVDDD